MTNKTWNARQPLESPLAQAVVIVSLTLVAVALAGLACGILLEVVGR